MKIRKVDVVVIGAGSAGMNAFRAARAHTDNVVLIEGAEYGTTCARVGCMPSKLLIAAAEAAHAVAEASHFGIHPRGLNIDGTAVMERVKRERDRFVGFVVDSVQNIPAEQRLLGHAQFLDDHRLQVGDQRIVDARRIVIATGSKPSYPKSFAELGDRLVVNDDVFEWSTLPRSVAVFGPGIIGLELGQALSRLEVKTFMFGRSGRIGPLTDPAVIDSVRRTLSQEFYLDLEARVTNMQRVDNGVQLEFIDLSGRKRTEIFEYVLAATGRTANVDGLGLERTTLPLDSKGIPVFDPATMQIGDSHVFIAGDVDSDRPLLHEASDEGRIAGDNTGRYPNVRAGLRRSPLSIVFSDPQIAMIGQRYSELSPECVTVGSVSFEDQGRSRVMRQNKGLLRIYAEQGTGLFLGAEMFGPRAEHLGHLLAWAHQAKMTIDQMLEMPFYHPVVEEGLRTALRDARSKLRERPCLRRAA
ncbi:MAG: dihydrolipoyl dehydrogenase [Gemmatimonadales bacterium]